MDSVLESTQELEQPIFLERGRAGSAHHDVVGLAVGLLISTAAWLALVLSMAFDLDVLRSSSAALDLVTWGCPVAFAMRSRTLGGYLTVTVATSGAIAVILGTALVEARATGAFVPAFLAVGAASICAQTFLLVRADGEGWAGTGGPRHVFVAPDLVVKFVRQRRSWPRADLYPLVPSVAGLAIVVVAASATRPLNPGLWGLPASLPVLWYAGLVLLIAGVVTTIVLRSRAIGGCVTALTLALTGTPAMVYGYPRYSYTAKHIGVVAYILHYGRVHRSLDIYQAWPGLFSGVAWLARAGKITSLLTIATVWTPVIDVLVLLAVTSLARVFTQDSRRAWLAGLVFTLANGIGQDYFSPQSLSLFLAVAIFFVVLSGGSRSAAGHEAGSLTSRVVVQTRWQTAIAVLLSCALAVTHQVTPYLVAAALAILVLFKVVRPLWLPAVAFVPGAVWALTNLDQVRKYFNVHTVGNLGSNLATPGSTVSGAHKDLALQVSSYALAAGPGIVGALALLYLIRNRSRWAWAFAVSSASAAVLVVATNYGNEGILRVTLFALPWLAVLVVGAGRGAPRLTVYSVASLVAVLTATFLLADTGLDGFNAMRPGEIRAEGVFEATAPRGSYLIGLGQNPFSQLTYRYHDFHFVTAHLNRSFSPSLVLSQLDALVVDNGGHIYLETSDAAMYYNEQQGLSTPQQYRDYVHAIEGASQWKVIYRSPSTELLERT